jgi:hypothetical protein
MGAVWITKLLKPAQGSVMVMTFVGLSGELWVLSDELQSGNLLICSSLTMTISAVLYHERVKQIKQVTQDLGLTN